MSSINNTWVGYLNRSYLSIKNSVLGSVTNSNPELTDHGESNIFVIIISIFSGIAEMLNYYVDNMAREAFMSVCRRRSSVISHSKPLDYRIKANSPETVDLSFVFTDGQGDLWELENDILIPAGTTIISNTDSIEYRTTEDQVLAAGYNTFSVKFSQVTLLEGILLGTTDGSSNQVFTLPSTYAQGTISLSIGSNTYNNVDSWKGSTPSSLDYIVNIYEDNSIGVELGDGVWGFKPNSGVKVYADLYTTLGPAGNVTAGELTEVPSNVIVPGGITLTINNAVSSSGGALLESTEDIRKNAIYHSRINDRLVTKLDYKNLAESIPGVAKAILYFDCINTPKLYVIPEGGGIASNTLTSTVNSIISSKEMPGKEVKAYPAGTTRIVIAAIIKAVKNADVIQLRQEVENSLLEYGLETNQEINQGVRRSEIIATLQNLDYSAYVVDLEIYTRPYAAPIGHSTQLAWSRETLSGSSGVINWYLSYNSATTSFSVIRNRKSMGQILLGQEYNDGILKFTISNGSYSNGEYWEFKTYPFNPSSIDLEDFTIPNVVLEDLDITIV